MLSNSRGLLSNCRLPVKYSSLVIRRGDLIPQSDVAIANGTSIMPSIAPA